MADRKDAQKRFLASAGWGAAEIKSLAADASFRSYHRLTLDGNRAMLMDAPPPEDVRPFLRVAKALLGLNYSAPRILAEDEANGFLLLEDLGDDTFTRLLARGEDEAALYRLGTDILIDLHRQGRTALHEGLPLYDDAKLSAEAALLPDWYIPEMTGAKLAQSAQAEYTEIFRALFPLARAVPETMVLRDFHVDNLMRLDRPGVRACGLLDFQDAVAGPVTYDLMSLLEDARRDISPGLIAAEKDRYLQAFPTLDRDAFAASWAVLAAQRHAKVIGIFTRLMRRDGKPVYLAHIPRVWRLLDAAVAHPSLQPLKRWLDTHIPREKRGVPKP